VLACDSAATETLPETAGAMDAKRAHRSLENYGAVFHEVLPALPCSIDQEHASREMTRPDYLKMLDDILISSLEYVDRETPLPTSDSNLQWSSVEGWSAGVGS
jgi:hypothetical protein